MGSDGLFDNLFDKDIIECLQQNLNINKSKDIGKLEILNL
jgi:serine/threonine protein phosphatase PrpC